MKTLLKFYADWCGPCKAVAPTIDKLAEELKDQIIVQPVNIDDNPQVRADYGIRSIPAFVLVEDGKEIARRQGGGSYSEMKGWILGESEKDS